MEKNPLPIRAQIQLTAENTSGVRKLAKAEDRTVNGVANRLVAAALLKKAVKSLTTFVPGLGHLDAHPLRIKYTELFGVRKKRAVKSLPTKAKK